MKKSVLAALLAAMLSLSACGGGQAAPSDQTDQPQPTVQPSAVPLQEPMNVVATTYPIYLFTTAITQGVDGVEVTLMINQATSCLHDYSLTATDMKALEKADVIVMNGAGLEDFMADALARSEADVIDSSKGIGLLLYADHDHDDDHDHSDDHAEEHDHGHDDGHNHEGEDDPHIWMDPAKADQMLENICAGLTQLDGANAAPYQTNTQMAQAQLTAAFEGWQQQLFALDRREIITFHDGFQYFARAFELDLLFSIEEEEGAEASAKDIREISELINTGKANGSVPAVFTEVNGSDATAKAITRETGVEAHQLTMIMSGSGAGIEGYIQDMDGNMATILEALG